MLQRKNLEAGFFWKKTQISVENMTSGKNKVCEQGLRQYVVNQVGDHCLLTRFATKCCPKNPCQTWDCWWLNGPGIGEQHWQIWLRSWPKRVSSSTGLVRKHIQGSHMTTNVGLNMITKVRPLTWLWMWALTWLRMCGHIFRMAFFQNFRAPPIFWISFLFEFPCTLAFPGSPEWYSPRS